MEPGCNNRNVVAKAGKLLGTQHGAHIEAEVVMTENCFGGTKEVSCNQTCSSVYNGTQLMASGKSRWLSGLLPFSNLSDNK